MKNSDRGEKGSYGWRGHFHHELKLTFEDAGPEGNSSSERLNTERMCSKHTYTKQCILLPVLGIQICSPSSTGNLSRALIHREP